MLERLIILFKNSATPAAAPSREFEHLQAPSTKPSVTWQEKVQQLGVDPTNTASNSPDPTDFSSLPQEQSDAWLHQRRMRRIEETERYLGKYGHRYRFMHLSALSTSTRRSHAERHGQLFTGEQLRIFWSDEVNIKGCKCSFVEVMLDEQGRPIVGSIVDRARAMYLKYQSRLN